MTVSTEVNQAAYTGNGVTTVFPYTFRILKSSNLTVTRIDLLEVETVLTLGTDYTVSGAGTYNGGAVTLPQALPSGYSLVIVRDMDIVQETDLRNQGTFFAEVHEDAFDYLTMIIQQVASWFGLALRRPTIKSKFYDAKQYRIANLADPINDQDAVNTRSMRSYVEKMIAGVVGGFGWFIQSGGGAINRTFQDKMRDALNPKDYGAKGDAFTNDSASFAYLESFRSGGDIDLSGLTYLVNSIPSGNRYFNGKFLVSGITYDANHVLARDINNVVTLGVAAGSLPVDYVMPANRFANNNASIVMGSGSLALAKKINQTISIGAGAMSKTTQTYENTAIGEAALQNINSTVAEYSADLTGTRNIAIGGNAGQFLHSGYNNIFIGRNSGTGFTAAQMVTAVGSGSLFGINVNGWYSYVENFAPNNNSNTLISTLGAFTGNIYQGVNLVAVGPYAGRYLRTGQANTLLGVNAGRDLEIDLGVYGYTKTDLPGESTLSSYVKTGSLIVVTCPGHNSVVGGWANIYWSNDGPAYANHNHAWPQQVLAVSGDTFTVSCPYTGDGVGTSRVYWTTTLTPGAAASSITLIGNATGQSIRSGNNVVAIGATALFTASTANSCIAVGKDALRNATTPSTTVAIGTQAMMYNPIANSCTAVGHNAGQLMQDGTQPTGTLTNSMMLGANSRVSGNNQVQIGDSATNTYVYGTVQNRSDIRDKEIDNDSPKLGIEFINGLNPVQGRWDMREDYLEEYLVQIGLDDDSNPVFETKLRKTPKDGSKRRNRLHQWFIAQEVVALIESLGLNPDDIGIIQHHASNGGGDVYSMGYDEFIPPVVSAIQSCWKRLDDMEKRLESLESQANAD